MKLKSTLKKFTLDDAVKLIGVITIIAIVTYEYITHL